ncbi:MAG: hypothetical protein LRY53_09240 [Burkholderiaceae bacterium]|nr:hypothetical protein [Burkholderiaceae bacterium]MCD8517943.1 hypothetical protein [Burkholderiaceae bacterium]MCD8565795.1 hypothetical protein [Burkholderiaceae bacterium]
MATKAETTETKSDMSATDMKDTAKTQVETKVAEVADAAAPAAADAAQQNVNVTGRSVFAVETTAAGVVVRTAFLTEENRLLDMPAVFPNMIYAMNVIDDLRRQVMQHFSQAAQVGAQVIANQARMQQEQQQGQAPAEAPKA